MVVDAGPARRLSDAHAAPLDGLRGIAIALVLWFHIWQITWLRADVTLFGTTFNFNWICETGFVGVDLFFFVSGFCLFYPYARARFDGAPPQGIGTFAYRRFIKIVPSYLLAIAAFVALGWATFASPADEVTQIVRHLLFVHTFWNDSYGSINGVLWSLAVEVQFYLIFPALAWAALRRPFSTFLAIAVVANAYRIAVSPQYDAVHLMDQLPGALDLFGGGMLAAYAYRAIAVRAPRVAAWRAAWTALALAGFAGFYAVLQDAFAARLVPGSGWPVTWHAHGNAELVLAFLALTLGSLFAFPLWQRLLANPALTFLSAISYNLYLWHAAVAHALVAARLPPWAGSNGHADPRWGLAFSFVATASAIAVATLVTYAFEHPLLRGALLRVRRDRGTFVEVAPSHSRAVTVLPHAIAAFSFEGDHDE
jgi:peptidoglycan/LPS O-acetylase OafA/YrhL